MRRHQKPQLIRLRRFKTQQARAITLYISVSPSISLEFSRSKFRAAGFCEKGVVLCAAGRNGLLSLAI